MNRRNMFGSGLLAAVASLVNAPTRARAQAAGSLPRAVYHLSDVEKPMFVLGNISNHFAGVGGAGKVNLALVVHGPPLTAFRRAGNNDALKAIVTDLRAQGLALFACSNTMRGMNLTLDQLLPGFAVAEKGGVVKLAELQGQGWAYLRP